MFREDSFPRLNDVKVLIEDDDGTLLSFPRPENFQYLLAQDHCKNTFIHIEAITISFSVVYLQRDLILSTVPEKEYTWFASRIPKYGYYAKFPAEKDTFIYVGVNWDQREQDIGKVFIGILVGEGFVIVVQEIGRYAERVGCFLFVRQNCFWYNGDNWIACHSLGRSLNWIEEIPKVRQKIRLG
jgi:hypothetical protein